MQQQFKDLFYPQDSNADAAIYSLPDHILRVEVNDDESYNFDGVYLQFTLTSCLVVIAEKTSKGIAYSLIHRDESITAEDIRHEFQSKQDGGKMIFICKQSTENDEWHKKLKKEFGNERFIYFRINKSYGYIPFKNINYFIYKLAENKKDNQTRFYLGAPVNGRTYRKVLPCDSMKEYEEFSSENEVKISGHPHGLVVFAHDCLTKAFATKQKPATKANELILYDQQYWLPMADKKFSIPLEAIPLYNTYIRHNSDLQYMYTKVDEALKEKRITKLDADVIVSLLLCYKHEFNIHSLMEESIGFLLKNFEQTESKLRADIKLVLNNVKNLMVKSIFFPNKLSELLNSLKESLEDKPNNSGDLHIDLLEKICNYLAVCLNTYVILIDYDYLYQNELLLRKRVEGIAKQALTFFNEEKYHKMFTLTKETIGVTHRFCLVTEPLFIIFYMELAENYSKPLKKAGRCYNAELAMQTASKVFSYKQIYYANDIIMFKLYDLLNVLIIDLCRRNKANMTYISEIVCNLVVAQSQQTIQGIEQSKVNKLQLYGKQDVCCRNSFKQINREKEYNLVLDKVSKLFPICCKDDGSFAVLQQQLDIIFESPNKNSDKPMRQLIASLINKFNKFLKKSNMKSDNNNLPDNKTLLKLQFETWHCKITSLKLIPHVIEENKDIPANESFKFWTQIPEEISTDELDELIQELNNAYNK